MYCASMRDMMSVVPPGAEMTTIRIGLSGKAAAELPAATASVQATMRAP